MYSACTDNELHDWLVWETGLRDLVVVANGIKSDSIAVDVQRSFSQVRDRQQRGRIERSLSSYISHRNLPALVNSAK